MATKDPKKKIITETVWEASPYEFEGTLVDLRKRIDEWIEMYGPDSRVDWNPYRQYDYEGYRSPCFNILRDREETDGEQAKRLKEEADRETERLARERKEFERLKQQFNQHSNSKMNDEYRNYMDPQVLPCGNIAYFDYGSGCAHRCEHCMAVLGSVGMPRECKQLQDMEKVVAKLKGNPNGRS